MGSVANRATVISLVGEMVERLKGGRATGDSLVAVYGTLKWGESNHSLLGSSRLVGRCRLRNITLYDLGPYPAAILEPSEGIAVEVYSISATVLQRLDVLEDYRPGEPLSGEYHRKLLDTPLGLAWLYLYNGSITGLTPIRHGGWQQTGR